MQVAGLDMIDVGSRGAAAPAILDPLAGVEAALQDNLRRRGQSMGSRPFRVEPFQASRLRRSKFLDEVRAEA